MGLERWSGPSCWWICRSDREPWWWACKFGYIWGNHWEGWLWVQQLPPEKLKSLCLPPVPTLFVEEMVKHRPTFYIPGLLSLKAKSIKHKYWNSSFLYEVHRDRSHLYESHIRHRNHRSIWQQEGECDEKQLELDFLLRQKIKDHKKSC
jgi:hypothetical protein